jgi:hypothetical protein
MLTGDVGIIRHFELKSVEDLSCPLQLDDYVKYGQKAMRKELNSQISLPGEDLADTCQISDFSKFRVFKYFWHGREI